jgi:hypothetical protein
MNAINKYFLIQPSLVSEAPAADVEQPVKQIPKKGIVQVADAFENFQPSSLNLMDLSTPITTQIANEAQTIDASAFSDVLGNGPTTMDVPGSVNLKAFEGSGSIRWDLIEQMKSAMAKGDANELAQILQKMPASELGPTLSELSKSGTPSELQLMVDLLSKNPPTPDLISEDPQSTMEIMGSMVSTLVGRFSTDSTVKAPLIQILNRMQGKPGADKIVRDIFEQSRGQNILGKLDQSVLSPMYSLLQSDNKTVNALCAKAIFDETGIEPEHCPGTTYDFFKNPDKLFNEAIKDPYKNIMDIRESMRLFPQWGTGGLNTAAKNNKLHDVLLCISPNGQNIVGPLFAELCKQNGSENLLTQISRDLRQYNDAGESWIGAMIQNLGGTDHAVQVLSKYSPSFLIDLKISLENGPSKEKNERLLQDVIQPALDAAINRKRVTQFGLSGMDLGKFIF